MISYIKLIIKKMTEITVKYGDVISGMKQVVHVNVYADKVNPDKWEIEDNVGVACGEKWYYGKLLHKDDTKSEQYLIRDEVGDDGWGVITIYKNVKVIERISNHVPFRTYVRW